MRWHASQCGIRVCGRVQFGPKGPACAQVDHRNAFVDGTVALGRAQWLNRFIMLSEDSLDVFDRFHGPGVGDRFRPVAETGPPDPADVAPACPRACTRRPGAGACAAHERRVVSSEGRAPAGGHPANFDCSSFPDIGPSRARLAPLRSCTHGRADARRVWTCARGTDRRPSTMLCMLAVSSAARGRVARCRAAGSLWCRAPGRGSRRTSPPRLRRSGSRGCGCAPQLADCFTKLTRTCTTADPHAHIADAWPALARSFLPPSVRNISRPPAAEHQPSQEARGAAPWQRRRARGER